MFLPLAIQLTNRPFILNSGPFCFRYLDKYEKAHFLGETHNAIEDDEDTGGGRHKRWSNVRNAQPTVPLAYNHSQHQITGKLGISLVVIVLSFDFCSKTFMLSASFALGL
jgi:hypothetical protein